MSRLFLQNTPLAFFEREMMAKPGFGRRRVKEDPEDIIPPWEETSHIAENPYEAYHFPIPSFLIWFTSAETWRHLHAPDLPCAPPAPAHTLP